MGKALRGVASCMLVSVIVGCGLKPAPRMNPVIVETPLPDGVTGRAYSATIALEEGKGSPPFTWSLGDVSEGLGWLTIDPTTGVLGGTPTAAVNPAASFRVTVTDVIKRTGSAVFTLAVRGPPVIVTGSLPDGTVNSPYDATIAAEGGTPPYTWSLRDVPDALGWLTIDAMIGTLGGTPEAVVQPGATFTVAVTDADLVETTKALTLATTTCVEGTPCVVPSGTQCMFGTMTCQNGQPSCQADAPSNSAQTCGAACGACDSSAADRCTQGECACGSGGACSGGTVVCCPGPTTGEASCTNTQNEPSHCGSCGNECPSGNHASPACAGGTCGLACDAGWGQCAGDGACDTDLNNDVEHCGSCNACPTNHVAARSCSGGTCQIVCEIGYGQCGTSGPCDIDQTSLLYCPAGCEVCPYERPVCYPYPVYNSSHCGRQG